MAADLDPSKEHARKLLRSAEPFLPPPAIALIKSDIENNEPELGLDESLNWLLARGGTAASESGRRIDL